MTNFRRDNMIEITRESLLTEIPQEEEFALKIATDRYFLKDNDKEPVRDDVVVAEFTIESPNQAGFMTVKEVGIVNSYDPLTRMVEMVLFTGERGKVVEAPRTHVDVLQERSMEELQVRVAGALSGGDEKLEKEIKERLMSKIIFGGRILTGAGTNEELTYFNCYVAPFIHDSRGGIAEHRKIVMEIMSRGGGVGTNGSTLRPSKVKVHKVRGKSSGAVSWLDDLSQLTHKVEQGGSRRGAQMICLADFHPDLIQFITAKAQKPLKAELTINGKKQTIKFGKRGNETLSGANISVLISDKFMEKYYAGEDWELRFPDVANYTKEQMEIYDAEWTKYGDPDLFHKATGLAIKTHAVIPARDIVNLIGICAHGSAEPGVLFLERANKFSNTWYFNPLIATNPCGEQFLAKWSVCNLGHVNLAEHVIYKEDKFQVDWNELGKSVRTMTRALDNVIDATPYYFEENKENQLGERRLGLGTLGIDELLKLCGYDYGTQEGRDFAEEIFKFIAQQAYETSIKMASEKRAFPNFDADKFLQSGFMKHMLEAFPYMEADIRAYGIRNATILTQAPTGTTGTLLQTSTGIEPFFASEFWRASRIGYTVQKAPVIKRAETVGIDTSKFKYAGDYTTEEHLLFQAVAQKWNDSSISKTINAPKDTKVEDVTKLIEFAYEHGLKGFTVYVDGSRETQVLGTEGSQTLNPELEYKTSKVKNIYLTGEVLLGYDKEELKSITVNLDSLKDVNDEVLKNALSHAIQVALESHSGTQECPNCGAPLVFEEGCTHCVACSYSKCG